MDVYVYGLVSFQIIGLLSLHRSKDWILNPPGTSFGGSAEPYDYESSANDASTAELESGNSKSDRGSSLYSRLPIADW